MWWEISEPSVTINHLLTNSMQDYADKLIQKVQMKWFRRPDSNVTEVVKWALTSINISLSMLITPPFPETLFYICPAFLRKKPHIGLSLKVPLWQHFYFFDGLAQGLLMQMSLMSLRVDASIKPWHSTNNGCHVLRFGLKDQVSVQFADCCLWWNGKYYQNPLTSDYFHLSLPSVGTYLEFFSLMAQHHWQFSCFPVLILNHPKTTCFIPSENVVVDIWISINTRGMMDNRENTNTETLQTKVQILVCRIKSLLWCPEMDNDWN